MTSKSVASNSAGTSGGGNKKNYCSFSGDLLCLYGLKKAWCHSAVNLYLLRDTPLMGSFCFTINSGYP